MLIVNAGVANFWSVASPVQDLVVIGNSEVVYTLNFAATYISFDNSRLPLSTSTTITLRNCTYGEQYVQQLCQICAPGELLSE